MTEKQLRYMRAFVIGSSEFIIDDNVTHTRLKRYEVLDKLNEQDYEIFQLKRIIKKHCPPYVWNAVKLGDY